MSIDIYNTKIVSLDENYKIYFIVYLFGVINVNALLYRTDHI